MKVKWRQHEILIFTLFVSKIIADFIWEMSGLKRGWKNNYEAYYIRNNIEFDYITNISLPQIGSVLFLYLCYLWINWFVIPLLSKLSYKEPTAFVINISLIAFQVLAISFVFALGINVATYFAHPHIINYGPFDILALLGYNDTPLTNIFFGFDRALALMAIYMVFAALREAAIYFIEKPGPQTNYRILIINQFTTLLLAYLSIITVLLTFHNLVSASSGTIYILHISIFFIPSVLLLYMSNIYWVFPLQENPITKYGKFVLSKISVRMLVHLLLVSLLCTLPFALIYVMALHYDRFFLVLFSWWALQLLLVTPLSWMLFQQRKDKILQLRGAEKELVKSKANLQFLRSQINPHFLFNSLNTLYGTALLENSERTAEGIQKLGDMMRFMLHENNLDFIPMDREIEYLTNYISLQKLRTQSSSKILIEDHIPEKHCPHRIAPMLLIPFVENAFKHGISLQEKSWISIRLDWDEEYISFEIRNSRHPVKDINPHQGKSGIGLANVIERLELLYPGRHQLDIGGDAGEFVVQLSVRISTTAPKFAIVK
jgi:sensor histidine kinase YesM